MTIVLIFDIKSNFEHEKNRNLMPACCYRPTLSIGSRLEITNKTTIKKGENIDEI